MFAVSTTSAGGQLILWTLHASKGAVMRNRWEDTADIDEPITLTERQLRSLRLGARAGLFALVLALAATGLAGWSTLPAGKPESGMGPGVPSATQQPTPPQN